MRNLQRELHQQLRAEALAARERIERIVKPLDEAKLNEHPEPKGWSIAQVLEHLILGDEKYEAPLAELLRSARPDAGAQSREWKSSLLGGMIAGAILKPRPVKAPKVFDPGPTPRRGIAQAFLGKEMSFVKAMDDAAGYDWRALRIGSPALPSWMPKMNIGDSFRIHVVHATRHAGQIERLAGKL